MMKIAIIYMVCIIGTCVYGWLAYIKYSSTPLLLTCRGAQFIFPLFQPHATVERPLAATRLAGFFCVFRSKASPTRSQTGPKLEVSLRENSHLAQKSTFFRNSFRVRLQEAK